MKTRFLCLLGILGLLTSGAVLADDSLAQAEWPWLIEQHPELL